MFFCRSCTSALRQVNFSIRCRNLVSAPNSAHTLLAHHPPSFYSLLPISPCTLAHVGSFMSLANAVLSRGDELFLQSSCRNLLLFHAQAGTRAPSRRYSPHFCLLTQIWRSSSPCLRRCRGRALSTSRAPTPSGITALPRSLTPLAAAMRPQRGRCCRCHRPCSPS